MRRRRRTCPAAPAGRSRHTDCGRRQNALSVNAASGSDRLDEALRLEVHAARHVRPPQVHRQPELPDTQPGAAQVRRPDRRMAPPGLDDGATTVGAAIPPRHHPFRMGRGNRRNPPIAASRRAPARPGTRLRRAPLACLYHLLVAARADNEARPRRVAARTSPGSMAGRLPASPFAGTSGRMAAGRPGRTRPAR